MRRVILLSFLLVLSNSTAVKLNFTILDWNEGIQTVVGGIPSMNQPAVTKTDRQGRFTIDIPMPQKEPDGKYKILTYYPTATYIVQTAEALFNPECAITKDTRKAERRMEK